MSNQTLRSRSQSVDSRPASVYDNGEDNTNTQFSQEGRDLIEENPRTAHLEFGDMNRGPVSSKPNSNDQPNDIPDHLLREVLLTVQHVIKSELASTMKHLQAELKNDRD
jgi:hypothetical protein